MPTSQYKKKVIDTI